MSMRCCFVFARRRSAVVDLVHSADDHGLASLEARLQKHTVGKKRTFFNGAENRLPVFYDIDVTLVAVLNKSLRRNPRQNAGRGDGKSKAMVALDGAAAFFLRVGVK